MIYEHPTLPRQAAASLFDTRRIELDESSSSSKYWVPYDIAVFIVQQEIMQGARVKRSWAI
jgi:hypothetical protein